MAIPSTAPSAAPRRVQLMATCLCDAFFDDAARATVEVLEHLGVEVSFPEGQTCCGQPAFNGGDWKASRAVVRHTLGVFSGEDPVVVPSGSCAAMLRHGALLEFEAEADLPKVRALADRTWEFADYLVRGLGVNRWPGRYPHRVAFHRNCHNRGTPNEAAALALLGSIEGIELVPIGEADQCCGFGGTFSVGFPHLSGAIGSIKLEHVRATGAEILVSGDMSCLMHLGGLAAKEGKPLRTLHISQVLRDALAHAELRR
jgi:L-lactate dehydrogenase complex protein LldE